MRGKPVPRRRSALTFAAAVTTAVAALLALPSAAAAATPSGCTLTTTRPVWTSDTGDPHASGGIVGSGFVSGCTSPVLVTVDFVEDVRTPDNLVIPVVLNRTQDYTTPGYGFLAWVGAPCHYEDYPYPLHYYYMIVKADGATKKSSYFITANYCWAP